MVIKFPLRKKLQEKGLGLHINHNSRFKAHSPEWVLFSKIHGRSIRSTFYAIENRLEELKKLEHGQSITTSKGIVLTKKINGSYSGNKNMLTLKVGIGNSEFFVKIAPIEHTKHQEQVFHQVLEYLDSVNHKVDGFNVGVIKPHVFLESKDHKRVITVTDFYHPDEVVLGVDLSIKEQEKLKPTVSYLSKKLAFRGVSDVGLHNLFFDKRNNSILLFDLSHVD
ncbi:MAG: hypothetical protein WC915_06245 [archaeon]|jgi:hypothetical protein